MRDELKSDKCAKYLKALADPERLKLVQCLRGGAMTVGKMAGEIGGTVANVSHHLQLLRRAGLVSRKKRGRFVFYELAASVRGNPPERGRLDVLELGCCRIDLKQAPE